MKGLTYALELVDKTFGPVIKKAKAGTKGLDDAMKQVGARANAADAASNKSFGNIGRYAKRAAAAVGLVFAIGQVSAFANGVEDVGAKFQGFENAINFASGKEGGKNIEFLNGRIKGLSLDMTSAYKGFQTLTGSMKGTKLEGQGVRDIFDGVAIAATSMNLSAEQSEGAFLALSQMASKGKVQAEELRGQLGERIPGAFKIASDAMGVSQAQFDKMLEQGQIYAEDFLPKFAKALKENFSGGLEKATKSLQASKNRSNNAFTAMQRNIAENMNGSMIAWNEFKSTVFTYIPEIINQIKPLIDAIIGLTTDTGNGLNLIKGSFEALGTVIGIFSEGFGFMLEYWKIFTPLIFGAIAVIGYYKLAALAATAQTSIWAVVQGGLNAALIANPIGIVVMAIAALIGGVIYAYKKVDWFRGSIDAAWTAIKGFGNAIKTFVIDRFKQIISGIRGVAQAIKFIFQGEWSKAFEAGKKATNDLFGLESGAEFVNNMKGVGKDAANAYRKGAAEANANKKEGGFLDSLTKMPGTANNKLLGNTASGSAGGGMSVTGSTPATVVGAGGDTTKNTIYNIQSLVQNLTVQTTNLTGNPGDVKAQLERIFLEIMADLELRANG